MALNAGSLAADLANRRELAPFWLVTGSEDLLMLESADLLRRRARELMLVCYIVPYFPQYRQQK